MFPVTRPLRQTVSTIVLLVLTVVPTALVSAIAWRINRPGHIRDVEIDLGRKLGMQVSLDQVGYPGPERSCTTAWCCAGRAAWQRACRNRPRRRGSRDPGRSRADVAARKPEAACREPWPGHGSAGLDHPALDRAASRTDSPFCRVVPARSRPRRSAIHVQGRGGRVPGGSSAPALKLAYQVPGAGKGSRCELVVLRDRRAEPFVTSLTFKTLEGSPLPARILNVFFDAEDWLGSEANVTGTLSLRQSGSTEWKAEFHGELLDVDLARLIGRRFPRHRLTGRARLAFEAASWGQRPGGQGPGWVEIKGELVAGQGSIGVDFLEALRGR